MLRINIKNGKFIKREIRTLLILGIVIIIFLLSFILAIGEISTETYSPLKDLGYSGMEIVNYKVNGINFIGDDYSSSNFDFSSTIKSDYSNSRLKLGGGINQEVYINNKLGTKENFNVSILIKVNYDKITWNGKDYKFIDYQIGNPLILKSIGFDESGNLIVPLIFFDDKYYKTINYEDIIKEGGYVLVYQNNKINYIELIINNKEINALENSKVDPAYANSTSGFTTKNAAGTTGNAYGLTTNSTTGSPTDFWFADNNDKAVYHVSSTGVNKTGGFSTASAGAGNVYGIVTNGSDFIVTDTSDSFAYDFDAVGTNTTMGFKTNLNYNQPVAICKNASNYFILQNGGGIVEIYNFTGGWVRSLGYLNYPETFNSIAYNGSDLLVLNSSRILKGYSVKGVYIDSSDLSGILPSGAHYGLVSNGSDVWITDSVNDFVFHFFRYNPEYPQFSGYWDNNGTQVDGGIGYFNVTVTSTNGTVILSYNNTNYTASNKSGSSTIFNVTITGLVNGTYPYFWKSWGNGTYKDYNYSYTRSYTVNTGVTDSCSCPSVNTNWQINMADHCVISANCNLGTGRLNFTGAGDCNVSAIINTTSMGYPSANSILYMKSGGRINVK